MFLYETAAERISHLIDSGTFPPATPTMPIPLLQVDAFTDCPFAGNPAVVCWLDEPREATWMQDVAAEMNLSETAFLQAHAAGFGLRWFTPTTEVLLCGHATLASAQALWEWGRLRPEEPARFHTRSGLLTCSRRGDGIEMDFPLQPIEPAAAPSELSRGLRLSLGTIARSREDYLVELDSESSLRALSPDFTQLLEIRASGVIVTSHTSSTEYDFVSRYFAPAFGIDEDPVTGSAHCALGPYWRARLGKSDLVGYQASKRGGVIHVRVGTDRVVLTGKAVTVLRGELCCGAT